MLLRVVRKIHAHPDPHKIVCAKAGFEALYPSAQSFVYEWTDAADIHKNTRLERSRAHKKYIVQLQAALEVKYPHANVVVPTSREINSPSWNFRPTPGVLRGLRADVVVGPRRREYAAERNFPHWQRLIDSFNAIGLTVSAIGAADTSELSLSGLVHRSWDYDALDAGIELLQNCKLAVMTDSGGAHLAVLCGAPLKIIHERSGRRVTGRVRWYVDEMRSLATAHCEPILYGWNEPTNVVREAALFLEGDHRSIDTSVTTQ